MLVYQNNYLFHVTAISLNRWYRDLNQYFIFVEDSQFIESVVVSALKRIQSHLAMIIFHQDISLGIKHRATIDKRSMENNWSPSTHYHESRVRATKKNWLDAFHSTVNNGVGCQGQSCLIDRSHSSIVDRRSIVIWGTCVIFVENDRRNVK